MYCQSTPMVSHQSTLSRSLSSSKQACNHDPGGGHGLYVVYLRKPSQTQQNPFQVEYLIIVWELSPIL